MHTPARLKLTIIAAAIFSAYLQLSKVQFLLSSTANIFRHSLREVYDTITSHEHFLERQLWIYICNRIIIFLYSNFYQFLGIHTIWFRDEYTLPNCTSVVLDIYWITAKYMNNDIDKIWTPVFLFPPIHIIFRNIRTPAGLYVSTVYGPPCMLSTTV